MTPVAALNSRLVCDALQPALSVKENLSFWRDFLGGAGGGARASLARVGLGLDVGVERLRDPLDRLQVAVGQRQPVRGEQLPPDQRHRPAVQLWRRGDRVVAVEDPIDVRGRRQSSALRAAPKMSPICLL